MSNPSRSWLESVLRETAQVTAIILLSVGAAVVYGILHDQITARVCVEYFTIFHPPIFATNDPTLLGIGWGIIATWWVGFILGVPLALCSRLGREPRRSFDSLVRPIAKLLAIMGTCAFVAGVTGWVLAESGMIRVFSGMAFAIPRERHARFLADLWAHNTSYGVGFVGGVVLCIRVRITRNRSRD